MFERIGTAETELVLVVQNLGYVVVEVAARELEVEQDAGHCYWKVLRL
jgi:hypothetical protein